MIKTNGSRPNKLHAVFPYRRVITEQALKIHLQCRYFSVRFLLGGMATFLHVFWLSMCFEHPGSLIIPESMAQEHLSKYHFCSWKLRSNLFLTICWLILNLISQSCIWYRHICSWQLQFHYKPDRSISDRIQLCFAHGHERSSKRGQGSKQKEPKSWAAARDVLRAWSGENNTERDRNYGWATDCTKTRCCPHILFVSCSAQRS